MSNSVIMPGAAVARRLNALVWQATRPRSIASSTHAGFAGMTPSDRFVGGEGGGNELSEQDRQEAQEDKGRQQGGATGKGAAESSTSPAGRAAQQNEKRQQEGVVDERVGGRQQGGVPYEVDDEDIGESEEAGTCPPLPAGQPSEEALKQRHNQDAGPVI